MAKRKTEKGQVQFNSLRRLLKDKQVRLGEFDRLADQRRRVRVERNKRRLLTPSPPAGRALRPAIAVSNLRCSLDALECLSNI
jgi:hypothetical protein